MLELIDSRTGRFSQYINRQGTIPCLLYTLAKRARIFKLLWSPRIYSKEPIPARLCGMAGRCDIPIRSRFLAPVDCLKIPALNESLSVRNIIIALDISMIIESRWHSTGVLFRREYRNIIRRGPGLFAVVLFRFKHQ
jgi:hypothetical protein